jgi:Tol biopolymer transport system component
VASPYTISRPEWVLALMTLGHLSAYGALYANNVAQDVRGQEEQGMYHPVIRKPDLPVGLLMGLLLGLSLLIFSACGEQDTAKGDAGQKHKKSASDGNAPTNGQIVFRRWFDPEQTKGALFTMNPDGSHIRQITHPPKGWHDDSPAWSPDGESIAFHREKIDGSDSRIMLVNPETGDTSAVTQCTGLCLQDTEPAWAPDGDSLSFHRYRGPVETVMAVNDEIWIVGIGGSNPHQITKVDSKPPDAIEEQGSALSPNGKMLVFDRVRKEGSRYLSHAVFVQPIGSPEDAHQITPWNMNCQDHPEFSPDGKLVLFRCLPEGEDGPSDLYWSRPDGTGLHQLTHAPADKQYLGSSFSPSFSGGEGWITVGRTSGYGNEDNADVFRVRIEGGDVVREVNLTKSEIWDSAPVWGSHPPAG